jgi:hypothetical protein
MKTFVLFTHTRWDEAPRIRHQVARLIAEAGHRVVFVERASGPFEGGGVTVREAGQSVTVVRGRRLMHHQLRVLAPLDWANGWVVRRDLRDGLARAGVAGDFEIINFAHDAAWLRPAFPGHRITTVIHDDFEAQARLPWFGHVTRNLRATCEASDRVFAVSTPLANRLAEWCRPELLLPWSSHPYAAPHAEVGRRDTLLFWGYIDIGLDTSRIQAIARYVGARHPKLRLTFIGPTQVPARRSATVSRFEGFPNVEVRDAMRLEELPVDRSLATLIPYRRKGDVDATELPNKALPLLSRGLPIMKCGLPNMIRAPFILPVDDDDSLEFAIGECRRNFLAWQPSIEHFLSGHDPATRLRTLGIPPAR